MRLCHPPRLFAPAILAGLLVAVFSSANASAMDADPRVACAAYKAKIRQWKADQLRTNEAASVDPLQEYKNLEAIKNAMGQVLAFLGYSQSQLEEMRGWDINGRLSQSYFFKNMKRISRETSPYAMEQERGLMGKEPQTVAFCEGLGINVRAFD